MKYKLLIGILAGLFVAQVSFAEPDFEALADAIRRIENGPSLNQGELYGIHSVSYKDAKEARQICIRTSRHAWERYLAGNGLKTNKNGYIASLSKRYCPVNHVNWARMVGYYYKGDI